MEVAGDAPNVIHGLAPVLKAVGYHLDHLPEALHLLWSLAQDDDRPTNQFPDHPMRVLVEMADLRTGKPFDYLFAIIDAAESWLSEPSKLSPFNVLKPMLAVEASEHINSGLTLTFRSYGLSPDSVRVVRSRVIDLAIDQAKTADVVTAVRAVNALEAAHRAPTACSTASHPRPRSTTGPRSSCPPSSSWATSVLTRRAIRQSESPSGEPCRGTRTTAGKSRKRPLPKRSRGYIAPSSTPWLVPARRLGSARLARRWRLPEGRGSKASRVPMVATELANGRSATDVLKLLEVRLGIERAALDGISSAGRFLWDVFTAAPSVAIALLDTAESSAYPELLAFASIAVGALAEQGNEDAIHLARRLCDSDDLALKQNVAHALSWNRGRRQGLLPGELDLLIELAADEDDSVRASVGRAVFMIAQYDKASAVELLSKIVFRGHGKIAAEALSALIQQGPLTWADTDVALQRAVLDQLIECMKIDAYEITSALSDLSRTEPLAVTKMLMARVDRAADYDGFVYEALPHHWEPPLQVKETEFLSQCLVTIRDWLADNPPSAVRYFRRDDGATLYLGLPEDGAIRPSRSSRSRARRRNSTLSRSRRSSRVCRSPSSCRELISWSSAASCSHDGQGRARGRVPNVASDERSGCDVLVRRISQTPMLPSATRRGASPMTCRADHLSGASSHTWPMRSMDASSSVEIGPTLTTTGGTGDHARRSRFAGGVALRAPCWLVILWRSRSGRSRGLVSLCRRDEGARPRQRRVSRWK